MNDKKTPLISQSLELFNSFERLSLKITKKVTALERILDPLTELPWKMDVLRNEADKVKGIPEKVSILERRTIGCEDLTKSVIDLRCGYDKLKDTPRSLDILSDRIGELHKLKEPIDSIKVDISNLKKLSFDIEQIWGTLHDVSLDVYRFKESISSALSKFDSIPDRLSALEPLVDTLNWYKLQIEHLQLAVSELQRLPKRIEAIESAVEALNKLASKKETQHYQSADTPVAVIMALKKALERIDDLELRLKKAKIAQ